MELMRSVTKILKFIQKIFFYDKFIEYKYYKSSRDGKLNI